MVCCGARACSYTYAILRVSVEQLLQIKSPEDIPGSVLEGAACISAFVHVESWVQSRCPSDLMQRLVGPSAQKSELQGSEGADHSDTKEEVEQEGGSQGGKIMAEVEQQGHIQQASEGVQKHPGLIIAGMHASAPC